MQWRQSERSQVVHVRSLSQGGRDQSEQWLRDGLRLREVCGCCFKVGENLLVLSVDGATGGDDSEEQVRVCDCTEASRMMV